MAVTVSVSDGRFDHPEAPEAWGLNASAALAVALRPVASSDAGTEAQAAKPKATLLLTREEIAASAARVRDQGDGVYEVQLRVPAAAGAYAVLVGREVEGGAGGPVEVVRAGGGRVL